MSSGKLDSKAATRVSRRAIPEQKNPVKLGKENKENRVETRPRCWPVTSSADRVGVVNDH